MTRQSPTPDDEDLEIRGGGENMSSVKVERVPIRHRAVPEVALVRLPVEQSGESPHATVVLKDGVGVDEAELRQLVRDSLAHFKVVRRFSVVTKLPKTVTGMVQQHVLRGRRSATDRQ